MELKKIQNAFSSALYKPFPNPDGGSEGAIFPFLESGKGDDARQRFKVYQGNLVFTVLEQLSLLYPSIKKILGIRNFRYFAREMIFSKPSMFSDVAKYGYDFDLFLAQRSELHGQCHLFDLAKLESEIAQLAQMPLRENTVPDAKKSLSSSNKMPFLSKHIRLLVSWYQVEELYTWAMLQNEVDLEQQIVRELGSKMKQRALFVVHREEGEVLISRLPIELYEIFIECQGKKSPAGLASEINIPLSELLESINYFYQMGWVEV